MSIISDVRSLLAKEKTIQDNRVSFFAYDSTAYNTDDANGIDVYHAYAHNNIPSLSAIVTSVLVQEKGYRDQSSSIARMLLNHFFGRASYNLNKTVDVLAGLLNSLDIYLGTAGGLATLDENGHIPSSQLTEDAIEYKGAWNAETNTPDLDTVPRTKGDMYLVSVKGTRTLVDGEGETTYNVGDEVIFNGTIWQKIPTGDVDSVNGYQPDAEENIILEGDDIMYDSTTTVPEAITAIKQGLGVTDV